jgi:hypothetical protein
VASGCNREGAMRAGMGVRACTDVPAAAEAHWSCVGAGAARVSHWDPQASEWRRRSACSLKVGTRRWSGWPMQGCRIGEATKPGPAWDLGFDDPDGPLWPVSERADEYEGPSSPRWGSIECGQYWLMGNRRDSGSGGEGRGGVKMGLPPLSPLSMRTLRQICFILTV